MNFTPQDLVQYLKAASGAIPLDESGIYLVSEEDGDLLEKHWTGIEIADQVFIASDVRENTPAVYLLDKDERCVFCVDNDSILRCHRYDSVEKEWEEVSLSGNQDIIVHPSSRLSGGIFASGRIVFFQDPSGQLQGIQVQTDGRWEALPKIPDHCQQGGAHSIVVSDDNVLHILYIHQDNYIHHLINNPKTGKWNDSTLPGSGFEGDQVTNFLVIPDDNLTFEICALSSAEKLIRIDKEGVRTELGGLDQGRFVATSSGECVIETMRLLKKGIKAVTGTKSKPRRK
ncbi:hypothetical protein F5Y14DRAFT_217786 [Nemania sp. NC0429]|nr:hypothetical protein F5Y14DRAFT_217786 [Nemania sp. NC0429]